MSTAAVASVPRLPYVSATRFHTDFLNKQPFVATAMLDNWPAKKGFTPDRFRKDFGALPITVSRYAKDREGTFLTQTMTHRRALTLGAWIDIIERRVAFDDDPAGWSVRESHELFAAAPDLADELAFDSLFPRGHKRYRHYLWFGPPGYTTGLHTDEIAVNLLAHLHGRKTVTLYGPEQTDLLYPETRESVDDGNYSAVDVFNPDRQQHPRFFEAQPMVAELVPGDLLYIPRGWWHWVRGHDATISVSGMSHTA
jgi:hypothetical protein